jgi:hypothetical protein
VKKPTTEDEHENKDDSQRSRAAALADLGARMEGALALGASASV